MQFVSTLKLRGSLVTARVSRLRACVRLIYSSRPTSTPSLAQPTAAAPDWHSPPQLAPAWCWAPKHPLTGGNFERVHIPEFGSLWFILWTVSRIHVPDLLWRNKITDLPSQLVWNYSLNHRDFFYRKINRICPKTVQKIQSTLKSKNTGTKLLQHILRNVISTTQHELILYHLWMYWHISGHCACMQASKTEVKNHLLPSCWFL